MSEGPLPPVNARKRPRRSPLVFVDRLNARRLLGSSECPANDRDWGALPNGWFYKTYLAICGICLDARHDEIDSACARKLTSALDHWIRL